MKRELRTHGGGTLSWMTTWEGNSYARVAGGIVAYQRRNGVALALADPIGPADARAEAVADFIRTAELAGLVPCFFSADEATRPPSRPRGAVSSWRMTRSSTFLDWSSPASGGVPCAPRSTGRGARR
ncbi:phosphatidylglycerol lysyltransferase domain-containing protein [Microbacterium sp. Se63.02b]|uniref:phosphatidylglycerol lysyltransferase domain-containing protein n=1 Tax=Microbacterium sp. Se63.02b TaxID=2709304 RepID=UPI00237B3E56|nr:phosphatidylglycerol lysyltransferase domain-containing protein [Microbacterium sp. Se63.02b]